jgi:hypothetical protein
MPNLPLRLFVAAAVAALVAACGAGASTTSGITCPEPPLPGPNLALVYPPNNATGVSTTLPFLIVQGYDYDHYGPFEFDVFGLPPSYPSVASGNPTAPPSPLPSPLATAPGVPHTFFEIPLTQQMAPSTTYLLHASGNEYATILTIDGPCQIHFGPIGVGSFTTGTQAQSHSSITRR